jgi:hypothetical protein
MRHGGQCGTFTIAYLRLFDNINNVKVCKSHPQLHRNTLRRNLSSVLITDFFGNQHAMKLLSAEEKPMVGLFTSDTRSSRSDATGSGKAATWAVAGGGEGAADSDGLGYAQDPTYGWKVGGLVFLGGLLSANGLLAPELEI